MLLEEIERYAITAGIMRITSEVSLTARPFFEKRLYSKGRTKAQSESAFSH